MKSLVRNLDRPAVCGLGEGCPDGLDADRLFRRADPLVAPGGFRQQVAIVPRLVTDTATTMLSALLTWAPPSPTAYLHQPQRPALGSPALTARLSQTLTCVAGVDPVAAVTPRATLFWPGQGISAPAGSGMDAVAAH
jgi:hypothetical protein